MIPTEERRVFGVGGISLGSLPPLSLPPAPMMVDSMIGPRDSLKVSRAVPNISTAKGSLRQELEPQQRLVAT